MLANPGSDSLGGLRGRHKLDAQLLGKSLNIRGDQVTTHARNQPRELARREAGEIAQRNVNAHTIVSKARMESVGQTQVNLARVSSLGLPHIGEILVGEAGARVQTSHVTSRVKVENMSIINALEPLGEVDNTRHILRNRTVVELVEVLIIGCIHHMASTRSILMALLNELTVALNKLIMGKAARHLAFNQSVAQQHRASLKRVDTPPQNSAIRNNRQTVKQHAARGHRSTTIRRPMRFNIRRFRELASQLFSPRRVDFRGHTRPQAAGLRQIGGHHPSRSRLKQGRSGEERETSTARTLIVILRLLLRPLECFRSSSAIQTVEIRGFRLANNLHTQIREQAGEHATVNIVAIPAGYQGVRSLLIQRLTGRLLIPGRFSVRRGVGNLPMQASTHMVQLFDKVLPLAHAQETHVLGLALFAQLPVTRLIGQESIPDVQDCQEVRIGVGIPIVNAVCFLTLLLWALSRVLQGEECGDDDDGCQSARGRV